MSKAFPAAYSPAHRLSKPHLPQSAGAPPVYRPAPPANTAQRLQSPPVYRPNGNPPSPLVTQRKTALPGTAPPVYRPQAARSTVQSVQSVQPKPAMPGMRPAAPPLPYRPATGPQPVPQQRPPMASHPRRAAAPLPPTIVQRRPTPTAPTAAAFAPPPRQPGPKSSIQRKTLQEMIDEARMNSFLENAQRFAATLRAQLTPVSWSDGKGHTVYSAEELTTTEKEQISRYVSRMEDAIAMNEVLRGAAHSTTLSADAGVIVNAIRTKGETKNHPLVLWRKVGKWHNEDGDAVHGQQTILSTTDSARITETWGGNFTYSITVRPGERFIRVSHALIGEVFNEYLLPPGNFIQSESGPSLTRHVAYSTRDYTSYSSARQDADDLESQVMGRIQSVITQRLTQV